jgi:hypothetical protein
MDDSSIDNLHRTIIDHDGVIDMYIDTTQRPSWINNNTTTTKNQSTRHHYILRIHTFLRTSNTTIFYPFDAGRYLLQDDQSRMTILSMSPLWGILPQHQQQEQLVMIRQGKSRNDIDGHVDVMVNNDDDNHDNYNIVEIEFTSQALPLRLRFISEDVDTFHKDAYMHENYFASLMSKDFFNPMEPYILVEQST